MIRFESKTPMFSVGAVRSIMLSLCLLSPTVQRVCLAQDEPKLADAESVCMSWRVARVHSPEAARRKVMGPYLQAIEGLRATLDGNLGDIPEPMRAKAREDFEANLIEFEAALSALDSHPELIPLLADFDGVTTVTVNFERDLLFEVSRSLTDFGALDAAVEADPRLELFQTNNHPHERLLIQGGTVHEDKYWRGEIVQSLPRGETINLRLRDLAAFAGVRHASWSSLGKHTTSSQGDPNSERISVDAGGDDAIWTLRTDDSGRRILGCKLAFKEKETVSIEASEWGTVGGFLLPGRIVRTIRDPQSGQVALTETRVLLSAQTAPEGFSWSLNESVGPEGP